MHHVPGSPDYRRLFQSAPDAYLVLAPDLTIVAATDAYLEATMTQRSEIVGRHLSEVFPDNPDDPQATGASNLRNSLQRVLAQRRMDAMDVQKYDIPRPAGMGGGFEERFWSPRNTPVLGPRGDVELIIHRLEDRSALSGRTEEVLQESAERYRTTLDTLIDPFIVLSAVRDSGGTIVDFVYEYANPPACEFNRLAPEEQIGKRLLDLFPRHRESGLFETYCTVVETGEPLVLDDFLYADVWGGEPRELYFDVRASKLGDGLSYTWRDVTTRKRAEQVDARLAAIVESSGDAIIGLDAAGTIRSWNAAAERLYGYTAPAIIGRSVSVLFPPEDAIERRGLLQRVMEGETVDQLSTEDMHQQGRRIDVAITVSPVRDESGRIVGSARIVRDISDRKRFEQELKYYADHDALTGLFNRRRFTEELGRQVTYAARYPDAVGALLLGDLDNFKHVNDTLGHTAGDELIKGIARALRARLRETDVLGRLGGDEFAVLLPHTDLVEAQEVAESLCDAARRFESVTAQRSVHSTISIGLTPVGGEATAEESLAAADLAMYDAKSRGRDRVAMASGTGAEQRRLATSLGWSQRLREALSQGRLELYAQPIVSISDGSLLCDELLLRMHGEDGEVIGPSSFIDAAERFGIIADIDRWVIDKAIELLAGDAAGTSAFAINLSGISIGDRDLLAVIESGLHAAAVDPRRLTLEFTETAAIVDIPAAREFTRGLQRIGCTCALDDFGSGFGSFAYLKYLPVDILKIDGEYVRHLPGSESDRVLVKAIIDVARGLGKRTVAEHVASEPAIELLRSYGADYAQGFHVGTPRPLAAIAQERSRRRGAV